VGFDGVFDGGETDEDDPFGMGFSDEIPGDLPEVFAEALKPSVFFIFEGKWFGRPPFEMAHGAANAALDGGVSGAVQTQKCSA
jgi:hypothetical protein